MKKTQYFKSNSTVLLNLSVCKMAFGFCWAILQEYSQHNLDIELSISAIEPILGDLVHNIENAGIERLVVI